MSDWIPISERLPKNGSAVIVYAPNGINQVPDIVMEVYYNPGRWSYGYYNNTIHGVTHWMPLPEPPT